MCRSTTCMRNSRTECLRVCLYVDACKCVNIVYNPTGCFGLGFLRNVIPHVCGGGSVIRCGKRGADGFEFGSRDKDNPRGFEMPDNFYEDLVPPSRLRVSRAPVTIACDREGENADNFISRTVPNGRSSVCGRALVFKLCSRPIIIVPANRAGGNTYCRIIWSRVAGTESRNYLTSSER